MNSLVFLSSSIQDGNMSLIKGDSKKTLENRQKFFNKINVSLNCIAEVKQVHGNKIINISKIPKNLQEADGLMTNKPNIFLMIKAADCHQIAFYDPKSKAIALIHAGWKGLEKNIIQKTVKKFNANFGSKPEDILVKFGPAIGPCCYRMDIWTQAIDQLKSFGVLSKNIDKPSICTYHTNKYFSHRRAKDTGADDFRFTTILGLKTV